MGKLTRSSTVLIIILAVLSYIFGTIIDLLPPNQGINLIGVAIGLLGTATAGLLIGMQETRVKKQLDDEKKRLQIEADQWKNKFLEQQRNIGRESIASFLKLVRAMPPEGTKTRACCFMVNLKDDILEFFDGSGSFSEDERKLRFEKHQGLAGDVWARDISLFTEPRELKPNEWDDLGIINDKIGSILTVPVRLDHKVAAVLSIDSPYPLNKSKFNSPEMIERMEEAALLMGQIFQQSGICD